MRRTTDLAILAGLLVAFAPAARAAVPTPGPVPSATATPAALPGGPTPVPGVASPGPVDALVREAVSAPHRVSYVGQLSTIRWGATKAEAAIARIEHKAPDETRRTFLAPESLYGRYAVTHGTTTSTVDPSTKRVVVSDNPALEDAFAQSSDLALLGANYRAVAGPTESVANRAALSVMLVNVHTGERTMRLWIDTGTKLVLATEAYHADGSLAWRSRYDEIRFTGAIPDDVFATPHDFTRVEGRKYRGVSSDIDKLLASAGFTPISPKYLPDGFSVVGGDVSDVKGTRSLHLLYSDGIRSLSLFENNGSAAADPGALKPHPTRFENHDAWYVKDGPTTLLAWREHGLAFALVGDLDLRELIEIATSVVP